MKPDPLGRTKTHEPPLAVILAADINGLGAIRSLHRAGVSAVAVVLSPGEPSMHSRLPVRKIVADSGLEMDAALLQALAPLSGAGHVLIPTSDKFVSFMTQHRAELDGFYLSLPGGDVADLLIDKARETRLIEQLGIPLPRTVQDLPDSATALVDRLGLPIIIKPRSFRDTPYLGSKNRILRTAADAAAFYGEYRPHLPRFLAQEVILGGDDALWVCNCAFDERHELAGALVFQRLRTPPAHFGVTSYAISRSNDEIVQSVARLGRALEYVGPAMVEFKFDSRDGQYKYIELNPRLGMCNYLDTRCGINNVLTAYNTALGRPSKEPRPKQRDGVMYLSFYEDFYTRLKDGEGLFAVVGDYLAHALHPHAFAYFTICDPGPFCAAVVHDLGNTLRSVARRLRFKAAPAAASTSTGAAKAKQAEEGPAHE